MGRINNYSGFTLIELTVVIIIAGVLAALAVSRFTTTVEFSRASEAYQHLSVIRKSIERCYAKNGTYASCDDFGTLDVPDPSTDSGAHFTYTLPGPFNATDYAILATRNTTNGGDANDWIRVDVAGFNLTRSGNGTFAGIQ